MEKVTSWSMLKSQKRTADVVIKLIDGTEMLIEIKGLSRSEFDAINDKYEKEKSKVAKPQIFDTTLKKYFDLTEGEKFNEYQNKLRALDNLQMAELALAFLVVKPEGKFEDQVKSLNNDLLVGQLSNVITKGLELSGLGASDNDNISDAKKS